MDNTDYREVIMSFFRRSDLDVEDRNYIDFMDHFSMDDIRELLLHLSSFSYDIYELIDCAFELRDGKDCGVNLRKGIHHLCNLHDDNKKKD